MKLLKTVFRCSRHNHHVLSAVALVLPTNAAATTLTVTMGGTCDGGPRDVRGSCAAIGKAKRGALASSKQ